MTMIEKMARASHEFFRPIYNLPDFDTIPDDAKSMAYQHARAVLGGMDAPSEAMLSALTPDGIPGPSLHQEECRQFWHGMIEAAKAEKIA